MRRNNKVLASVCIKQGQVVRGLFYALGIHRLSICFKEFTHDISTYFMALCSRLISVYTTSFLPTTTTTIPIRISYIG